MLGHSEGRHLALERANIDRLREEYAAAESVRGEAQDVWARFEDDSGAFFLGGGASF